MWVSVLWMEFLLCASSTAEKSPWPLFFVYNKLLCLMLAPIQYISTWRTTWCADIRAPLLLTGGLPYACGALLWEQLSLLFTTGYDTLMSQKISVGKRPQNLQCKVKLHSTGGKLSPYALLYCGSRSVGAISAFQIILV